MKTVLVITGDGINCERETARAFEEEGAQAQIIHVNEFLTNPSMLLQYKILCFPGGFSFGDELRSGKILAEKMRASVLPVFAEFTKKGGLTLGVCNGFQVLIQLGVFGALDAPRTATLATNDHGKFWDQWVEVEITADAKNSPWFKSLQGTLTLPIRHKEGRILAKNAQEAESLVIPLQYTRDVNGSHERAAALLDPTGQSLGIMPHPEAATHAFLNPSLTSPSGATMEQNANRLRKLFQNAIEWSQAQ